MIAVLAACADRLTRFLTMLGAVGVVLMMLHVCLDVLLRTFGFAPIPATVEIVSYYYVVLLAFLPLAWVERQHSMIAMELLDPLLPSGLRRISDIAIALLATAIYSALTWSTWLSAANNLASGAFVMALDLSIPIWPSYFLPPV